MMSYKQVQNIVWKQNIIDWLNDWLNYCCYFPEHYKRYQQFLLGVVLSWQSTEIIRLTDRVGRELYILSFTPTNAIALRLDSGCSAQATRKIHACISQSCYWPKFNGTDSETSICYGLRKFCWLKTTRLHGAQCNRNKMHIYNRCEGIIPIC